MRSSTWQSAVFVGAVALLAQGIGCGSDNGGSVFGSAEPDAGLNNGAQGPGLQGTNQKCDTPAQGCACPTPGAITECGQTVCRDGLRKCIKISDEFSAWGPCHSASTGALCEDATAGGGGNNNTTGSSGGNNNTTGSSGGNNGTTGSSGGHNGATGSSGGYNGSSGGGYNGSSGGNNGATGSSGGNNGATGSSGGNNGSSGGTGGACVCKPGAMRWCDTPIACNWGQQTCAPDGQWGTCNETSNRPAGCPAPNPADPNTLYYDQDCCVAQGQCCQNLLHTIHPNNPAYPDSVGNCASLLCQ